MSDDDAFVDWLVADSYQDYRQQRAIRELGSEVTSLTSSLAAQRRESGRLRSELAQLQGTLDERVSRLTRAFDAFVELSDLRMTLALFDPPALIRHRVRQVLAEPSGAAGLGDFADVPGYWLGPATRAFVAALRGAEDPGALAEAVERDAARTALFLTIALAVADRPELSERWLSQALGPLTADEPLTQAQRALWIASAGGTFGASGRILLEERLADLVKGLPPEQSDAWAERAGRVVTPGLAMMGGLAGELGADSALLAAARLGGLRALCETSTGTSAGSPSPGDVLGGVLRSLVDEGSAEEAPLMRRAGELRAIIENRAEAVGPVWDAPAGTPAELLVNDAFEPGAGVRGDVARTAGARWIVAAAEALAERACAAPPEEAPITVARVAVRVRPNSENTTALGLVRAEVERRYPEPSGLPMLTIALAGTGVLLCLAVLGWPNGLAVVAVLVGVGLLIAAGVRWRRARRELAERRAAREGELRHAERQIQKTSVGLLALRERLEETRKQASTDLAAIRTALDEGH